MDFMKLPKSLFEIKCRNSELKISAKALDADKVYNTQDILKYMEYLDHIKQSEIVIWKGVKSFRITVEGLKDRIKGHRYPKKFGFEWKEKSYNLRSNNI